MEIKINKNDFAAALANAVKATGKKNVPGILSYVKLTALTGQIEVSGYNMELGISSTVPASVSEPGEICFDGATVRSFVSKCDNSTVELSETEKMLKIKCGTSNVRLAKHPVSDYPSLPSITETGSFTLNSEDLTGITERIGHCIDQMALRPTLGGLYITNDGGKITAVGCDGYRAAILNTNIACGKLRLNIPKFALKAIEVLPAGEVKISYDANHIIFECGNIRIISRLIGGEYVDYKRIIPGDFTSTLECDAESIQKVLARMESGDANVPLIVTLEPGAVRFNYNTPLIEYTDEVEAQLSGEGFVFGISYKMLREAVAGADKLTFCFNGPTKAVILRDERRTQMIMPMRLKGEGQNG